MQTKSLENTTLSSRVVYLDVLRVFSVFCMMMLHVAASNWSSVSPSSLEWQVFNFYDSLVRFCVPVFVMISGVFFLDPNKKVTFKGLISKNIPRVVVAFLFWSALYYTEAFFYSSQEQTVSAYIARSDRILTGHYHQWFLLMIVRIYLFVPLLRIITKSKKRTEIFILLHFLAVVGLRTIAGAMGVDNYFTQSSNTIDLLIILRFSGYFVIGYYLYTFSLSKIQKYILYSLGVLGLVFTIVATSSISVEAGRGLETWYDNLVATTYFVSIAVFMFFKEVVSKINWRERELSLISLLSTLAFGMYLMHDFINRLLYTVNLTTLVYNPIIAVPVNTVIVFVLSFIPIFLLSKIPVLNKYLM